MMGDNRLGHHSHQQHHNNHSSNSKNINSNHNNLEPCNEVDMLIHSESPQIQEFRLYRELSKEIEKNSSHRDRYVESELYSRSQQDRYSAPSGSSETQSAIINISSPPQAPGNKLHQFNNELHKSSPTNHQLPWKCEGTSRGMSDIKSSELEDAHRDDKRHQLVVDGNCQVCLVKELKDDLTNITKIIQERNEQLTSKLKARRLRTFFERQMLD